MTYDGRSQVGAPPATRALGGLTITKISVGRLDNNAYLLRDTSTGDCLLIDAAAEPETLLDQLPGGRLDAVVTTHSHFDHWSALAEVVASTGARTFAGALDADAIGVATDERLADGATIQVGTLRLSVIQLAGHTPGSIALHLRTADGDHIFTGDCLFPGGVGRTTPETFGQLFHDVTTKLFAVYDDETWIYPGHGWDTTLGAERPHLAQWRARGW